MTVKALQIANYPPVGQLEPGRGFYQLEEDSLYVQIGNYRKNQHFFSYLESEHVRLDFDRDGRLLFIEVTLPSRRWTVIPDWQAPERTERADIRWLDFRDTIPEPELLTDEKRHRLLLRFQSQSPEHVFLLANSVLLGVSARETVTAIWLTDIVGDLAGREIAAFRRLTAPFELPTPSSVK